MSTHNQVVLPGYSQLPPTASPFFAVKPVTKVVKKNTESELKPTEKGKEEAFERFTPIKVPSHTELKSLDFSVTDYMDSSEE